MTPAELDQLRALAQSATPGPWRVEAQGHAEQDVARVNNLEVAPPDSVELAHCADDAAYIAAVSPDVVIALLAEVDRLRLLLRESTAWHELSRREVAMLRRQRDVLLDMLVRSGVRYADIARRLLDGCRDSVTGEKLYGGESSTASVEDVEAAARYLRDCAEAEPVATVRVHDTGGNAGIAWSGVPTGNAGVMRGGTPLYAHPHPPVHATQPDDRDAMLCRNTQLAGENLDLAILVRRLALALRTAQPDHPEISDAALDYLRRIGHVGGVLR